MEGIFESLKGMDTSTMIILGIVAYMFFTGKGGEGGLLSKLLGVFTQKNSPSRFNLSAPENLGDFIRLLEPHQKLLADDDDACCAVDELIKRVVTKFSDKAKEAIHKHND